MEVIAGTFRDPNKMEAFKERLKGTKTAKVVTDNKNGRFVIVADFSELRQVKAACAGVG